MEKLTLTHRPDPTGPLALTEEELRREGRKKRLRKSKTERGKESDISSEEETLKERKGEIVQGD